MTHQQIEDNNVIEQYVRQKLSPAERQAFQEHYFNCDECFEHVQMTARFIAGVREASRTGVLALMPDEPAERGLPRAFYPNWFRAWAIPALAVSLLLAVVLIGLWGLSIRRENQRLAQQVSEQRRTSEKLRDLEAKVRDLEASGSASQDEKETLKQEIKRLKEQVATAERQHDVRVAQRQPQVDVPVINIYPLGDAQRSGGAGDVNQLRLPRDARRFVLILSDFQPGYANYRLEISDPSRRVIARRAGLKPDRNGELSVLLNRSRLSRGKYTVKLFGGGKAVAEYVVEID